MVDLDVLEAMGSTQDRLKEIFTSRKPDPEQRAKLPEEDLKKIDKDVEIRENIERTINNRLAEQVTYSLKNFLMYSAVDYAWDAPPINKEIYPIMLYAQGKLDLGRCTEALKGLPCTDKYTTKDDKGNVTGVNLPKFFEVNFNLVRSIITRRLAAQANKYNSLYPYYKYEPRSTSLVGKLRADVLSQEMDILVDQYDQRHHDVQVMRDSMLYAHSVDFVRCSWEREEQMVFDRSINPELEDPNKPKFKTIITKEGLGFVNPHPSRVYWDNAYPLPSINADVGGDYIGFWDVIRYGDVADNPYYWNRSTITYSSTQVQLFSTYAQYFTQYYCTIFPPCMPQADISSQNDRANNIGLYAQDMRTSSLIVANDFQRVNPKDMGIGDYPKPVWMRRVIAGDKTIIHAEFLPSSPACVCSINENDSRQQNISIAMELLPYQDQMTQLLSLLMLTCQSNAKILLIDVDVAQPEHVKAFRADVQGRNRYNPVQVFEYSGSKMKDLGITPRDVIALVETQQNGQAIQTIFNAMAELVKLSERLMALSPQELGQPAPSGISATEVTTMAATTETIYGFISDAIDEFRAAKKRILYESYMICGDQNIRVPVLARYTKKIIEKAGFKVLEEDDEDESTLVDPSQPRYHTIIGTKNNLQYDYIFTSRDGALRSINTQAANVLVQLLGFLQQPMVLEALPKEKYFDILNEIFRLSGAGVDLNIEVEPGDENKLGVSKTQQLEQALQAVVQNLEQQHQAMQQLGQAQSKMGEEIAQLIEEAKTLAQEVKRIDSKPTSMQVDPMKFILGRQQLEQGRQKMRHAEEKHLVDTSLDIMKAASENGSKAAYSK